MDQTSSALASAIGSRVRRERQARGWTLDRLAEGAGVSRRVVVNAEEVEPGDRHASEAHSAGTRELAQVQEGTVVIETVDGPVALQEGDAISFPGDVEHASANPARATARFTLTVFEPAVGRADRKEAHGA